MWLCSALLSLLTTNLIFTRALGTSTLMTASRNNSSFLILSLMMTGFSTFACLGTGMLYYCFSSGKVLMEYPYSLLLPLVYIAVISVIYIVVLLVLHRLCRCRFGTYKKYVHLSAFNCAVMGTLYLAFEPTELFTDLGMSEDYLRVGGSYVSRLSLAGAVLFGLRTGLGFVLAALMVKAVHKRLYDERVPAAFRGFPAVMVYIGLLSMAVYAIAA
jgi:electron transport complex protein RnfA